MKILFDLDGVLRSLTDGISAHLGKKYDPQSWSAHVSGGLDLCPYINLYPEILIDSPPTEYLSAFVECDPTGEILTCQPPNWIPYTSFWLHKHLPKAKVVWCQHPLEKLDRLNGGYLVEDYPFYEDNSRIIMVDRPYNQKAKGCFARVSNVDDLKELITLIKNPIIKHYECEGVRDRL